MRVFMWKVQEPNIFALFYTMVNYCSLETNSQATVIGFKKSVIRTEGEEKEI